VIKPEVPVPVIVTDGGARCLLPSKKEDGKSQDFPLRLSRTSKKLSQDSSTKDRQQQQQQQPPSLEKERQTTQ
jgi:hypothetical protein